MGPRKPQRLPTTTQPKTDHIKQQSPQLPTRVYLETSFTSLQSIAPASSASSNGLCSTSQSSPLPLANVISLLNQRARSTDLPINIQVNVTKASRSRLSLNIKPPIPDGFSKRIDLIHDDWLGLAPLASPESLSEVSSISSRASFNLEKIQNLSTSYELKTPMVMRRTPKINNNLSTCADDIRNVRYFQKLGQLSKHLRRPSQNGGSITNSSSNISFASANSSSKSDEHSIDTSKCCNIKEERQTSGESDVFQSAEDVLQQVIETAGCSDFFNKKTLLETHFDENMFKDDKTQKFEAMEAPKPLLLDPDLVSNFAIDLNLDEAHRSQQFLQITSETSKAPSTDSGTVTRPNSEVKNVTFNPEVINIDNKESPQKPKRPDRWNLRLPMKTKKIKAELLPIPPNTRPDQVPKTILCVKRRNSQEECFSRTEALPLLAGLNLNAERSSPSFVRRKKYVYPAMTILAKDESSL